MNTATSADMGKAMAMASTTSGAVVTGSGHCHHYYGLAEARP